MKQEEILKILELEKFNLIGFSNPNFNDVKEKWNKAIQKKYVSPLVKGTIDDKLSLQGLFFDACGVISVGMTYSKDSELIDKSKLHFGNSSWGTDYHVVIREKLERVAIKIKDIVPELEYFISVDNSLVDDRYLAYQSGLGFYGKNSLLINPELGSYFFIGNLITNLSFESPVPLDKACGSCDKCQRACPSGAINNTNILNSLLCKSYITQKKSELSLEEASLLNNCIFGCDICAVVCPYNQINHQDNKEFLPTGLEQIDDELIMSNKEFKNKYGKLSGSYIGKRIINRNIKFIKSTKYDIIK